jgi:hypothetical protein
MSELMMGADEKFVREHWAHVRSWVRDLDSYGTDQFNVALYFDEKDAEHHSGDYFQRWQEDNDCKGFNEVWSSAAEFTRSRLEEIRQVEREIDRIENYFWSASNWQENLDDLEEQGQVVDAVRQQCADVRIVARLQAALAELKRGMR